MPTTNAKPLTKPPTETLRDTPAPPKRPPVSRESRPRWRFRRPAEPCLRFSPAAWAKLLFLRDLGPTEIGGFGITPADDLLCVLDFVLVRQSCTAASVRFDDASVADFFDAQVDRGFKPGQFARIWLHTHPGDCPEPSGTDEETFERAFGRSDWAVMFIVACGGRSYSRLRFNVGPGGEVEIPVTVDYAMPFPAADHDRWEEEYARNVVLYDWKQEQSAAPGHEDDLLLLEPAGWAGELRSGWAADAPAIASGGDDDLPRIDPETGRLAGADRIEDALAPVDSAE